MDRLEISISKVTLWRERVLSSIENIERVGTAADINPRMPKVYVRNEYNQNPFELYGENEFKRRYRFFKTHGIKCDPAADHYKLATFNNRGSPILPLLQILIALSFYATGCFQMVCGDLKSIRFINKVSAGRVYDFRSNTHHGLNNIIGAIDCTHIKIYRTKCIAHSEAYRNRKGYFSVNVQAIIRPDMEIFDIVTRWPGSLHNSRIFRNCQAYARLLNGELEGVLVGNSGYPMTRADNYNYSQIRTRNIVKRCLCGKGNFHICS